MKQYFCHSGGAEGADSYFEIFGKQFGVKTIAYSYKTKFHNTNSKRELIEKEFLEGCEKVELANQTLQKFKYKHILKLLSRNWFQVKNADQIFAVGLIKKRIDDLEYVKGGTGWTIQMAIDHRKKIFVFDQNQMQWFSWDYSTKKFVLCIDEPKISVQNFAGIGTRKINLFGIQAIENLYINSFK